ncbi:MAG: hypothetical protein NTU47_18825 [Ignavibacteriales bacterium]|nr:hypothetical protein [Ignavibacteriales bacterium]
MTGKVKPLWQIVLLAVWINCAETLRWMLYTKPRFDGHFQRMGLELPNKPINGILWIMWGVVIAVIVFMLSKKFSLWQTTIITWLAVFVLVWIALWNSAVLPLEILPVVVPLSLITIFIAALIAKKLEPQAST